MIQNILALLIVVAVVARTIYAVYKAVTVKERSLCGGCASCELKNELKKKGRLLTDLSREGTTLTIKAENLTYPGK
jgi:hypothetical protein